jgi:hypothetical protein
MKKLSFLFIMLCVLTLITVHAQAISISIERVGPAGIWPGDNISFNVLISELGEYTSPSLGGFDINILFNPYVLEYVSGSAVFGPYLGNDPFGQWVDGPNPGPTYGGIDYDAMRIQELSLESTQWLYDNQPGSFTLASLTFHAYDGSGFSYIIPDNIDLSDALGNTITCSRRISSVNVIPEPATLLLVGCGLLARLSHFKKNMPIFNGLWLQSLQTSFKFCLGQVFLYW